MADTCKSCGAKVKWVRMTLTGKAAPLNAEPDPERGNVLIGDEDGLILRGTDVEAGRKQGLFLYLSHFATCGDAEKWRRK